MTKVAMLFALTVCAFTPLLTGCGRSADTTVVEPAPEGGGLSPEDQKSYEEAMKNQR